MQERHNSIANALGYVFLVLSHPYKECNFWVTTPPPYYLFQCNEINMIVFSIYVICSRQCPNGDGIYTLLYALYKYSTSITNQPTNMIVAIFFIIGQCTEHIASNYIATRHIESTVLGLSNSWYTTVSTTSNTYTVYIDYWSQADAVQSFHVNPLICHWYCFALVCCLLVISTLWGWKSTDATL